MKALALVSNTPFNVISISLLPHAVSEEDSAGSSHRETWYYTCNGSEGKLAI